MTVRNLNATDRRNTRVIPVKKTALGVVSWLICVGIIGASASAEEESFLKNYPLTYRAMVRLCERNCPSQVRSVSATVSCSRTSVPDLSPLPTISDPDPEPLFLTPLPTDVPLSVSTPQVPGEVVPTESRTMDYGDVTVADPVIGPLPTMEWTGPGTGMTPLPVMEEVFPEVPGTPAPLPVMTEEPELPVF